MPVRREGVWAVLAIVAILLMIVGGTGRFGVLVGCITSPSQLTVDTAAGNADMEEAGAGASGDGGGGGF